MENVKTPKAEREQIEAVCAMAQACRQNSKAVLTDILTRLERKQKHIKVLLAMLPSEMTPEQDEAMWQLACELERR